MRDAGWAAVLSLVQGFDLVAEDQPLRLVCADPQVRALAPASPRAAVRPTSAAESPRCTHVWPQRGLGLGVALLSMQLAAS